MSLDPQTPETGMPIVAYCRACGKGLTQEQVMNHQGTVYCAEHVPPPASPSSNPYTSPTPPSMANVSPGLAFVLGLIPGVGAIYNGQYAKGFVHVLITGVVFSIMDHGGGLDAFGPVLGPAWFFYMAFEAYHTARKRLLGEPVDEFSSIFPRGELNRGGPPVGPILLIGLGVLLLLHQLDLVDLYRIRRFVAPVVLIASGLFLLQGRLRSNSSMGSSSGPAAPGEMFHERS